MDSKSTDRDLNCESVIGGTKVDIGKDAGIREEEVGIESKDGNKCR